MNNENREYVIDNFAGGGGASTGIELALGQPIDIAVNHDGDAIAMHTVNHPYTTHYQEDVFAINPEEATHGHPVGIAWFSPDCKHFSKAKGDKPVEKKIRGLSWVILQWAMSSVAPRVIFMENVEEIQTWCPLVEVNGKMRPDATRIGETFNGFVKMLSKGIEANHPAFIEACEFLHISPTDEKAKKLIKGLGYDVEYRVLRACDYGAPTIRKRFYLVARNDGKPIIFPKPTYGVGKGLKPYKTAAQCINWSIPCPSIFGRKKNLVVNTQKRIARGLDKFVVKNPKPFILQANYQNAPQDIDSPLSTETTVNKHFVAMPLLSKYFSGDSQCGAAIDEPLPTVTAVDHNALIAPCLIQYYGGDDHSASPKTPLATVTTLPRHFLIESHLCVLRRNTDCKDMSKPLPTITTSAGHFAQVTTRLQKIEGTQDLGNWSEIKRMLNDYAGYKIANDEILLIEINGEKFFISDIGMRMLKAEELKLAQGFPKDYVIDIEPYIGKKYSEAKQIARLGNAVCPPVATALIKANCPEMCNPADISTMSQLNKIISKHQVA